MEQKHAHLRHIRIRRPTGDYLRTTIRLESDFWREIDRLAGSVGATWQDWVAEVIARKPPDTGAASWLRVNCLRARG